MSDGLTKYEVSAVAQKAGCAWLHEPLAQRFATLCRAPLVAEVERLKKDLSTVDVILEECKMDWSGDVTQIKAEHAHGLLALQADRDDWKARAEAAGAELARVRAGEPFAWARPDAVDASQDFRFIKIDDFTVPLYATPPQPAAQEPDCATTGVCVRSGLYASHPSAAPVVRQMVVALDLAAPYFTHNNQVTAAIAAGQQYLKENGK